MESKFLPSLCLIGEVLDIDGDTGGYNLQAAYSTRYLVGKVMSRLERGVTGQEVIGQKKNPLLKEFQIFKPSDFQIPH